MGQQQSDLYGKNTVCGESNVHCTVETNIYIPPEIMVKVFSQLDVVSMGRAAQVCRTWRDIAYAPVLWRNVEVSRLSPATLFGVYLRRGIRKITSPAEPFDRELWAQQVSAFALYRSRHNIEKVELSLDLMGELIYSRSDESLMKLLRTTSVYLRSLTVRYSKKDSFGSIFAVITSACANLFQLCFVNCLQRGTFDGGEFWSALRSLRQLRCLVLKDFYGIDDSFFKSLVDNQPTGFTSQRNGCATVSMPLLLTELHLEIIYGITNESVKYIGQSLPMLVEFKLLYCDQITYHGLVFLAACKHLRRLTLWCPRKLFYHQDWIKEDENGENFPDLKDAIFAISRCLSQLKSLIVVGCSYTSLEIMAKFSSAFISSRFTPSPDMRYTVIPKIKHVLGVNECRISTSGANQLITGSRNRSTTSIRWLFIVTDQRTVDIRRYLDYLETVISSENYWCKMLNSRSNEILNVD